MDLNQVSLTGRLVIEPLTERDAFGGVSVRMLVLVRSERGNRMDVIPVRLAEPTCRRVLEAGAGTRIGVTGALMRRCDDVWETTSSLEVLAEHIEFPDEEPTTPGR